MEIDAPFDAHVHFRQEEDGLLPLVVPWHDRVFEYALVMPNTLPPVLTSGDAVRYGDQVRKHCRQLAPLMTLKLLPRVVPESFGGIVACKLYPQVTTNAHDGFSRIDVRDRRETLYPALEAMRDAGVLLCVHGEMPGSFCLDREADFLGALADVARDFPSLTIVLEHVTTKAGVDFVDAHPNVAATVTWHHLECTLDDVVGELLAPHAFCKPIPKRPSDREALLRTVFDGHPRFFLGSDSAPHLQSRKECSAGCAGCFTAPGLLEGLIELFESACATHRLNDFVSTFGRRWYGLPSPCRRVTFEPVEWFVPPVVGGVIPYAAGRAMRWRFAG